MERGGPGPQIAKMALADEAKEDFYKANCEIDRIFAEIKWDRKETETEDSILFLNILSINIAKNQRIKVRGAFALPIHRTDPQWRTDRS